MFLSCSHSRKPDLPVTQPLPSSTWLSVLFPFFSPFPLFSFSFFSFLFRLIRAHGVLFRLAAEYSAAMCGVCPGTLVIWPLLRLSMIYCCSLRPWSQICVTFQSCWFLGSVALSSCAGASCLVPMGWRHIYEMDMEHFANKNLSVVFVKCWLLGFVV